MRQKKEEKQYLANFEFISGEYEQSFQKIFYARDENPFVKKTHKHFRDYGIAIDKDEAESFMGKDFVKCSTEEYILNDSIHKFL